MQRAARPVFADSGASCLAACPLDRGWCMQVCHALHPKCGGQPHADLGEVAAKVARAKVSSIRLPELKNLQLSV